MKFISVPHSLNQTYHVEYNAIEQAVKKAFTKLKGYKLESLEITESSLINNINILANVTLPTGESYEDGTIKINDLINGYLKNLIRSTPKNIQIIINK